MSQFQILGRRPLPFKAVSIRFAYTNFSGTIREGDDPDIFERDLEKYIDWYNNVHIKRRLDGSSPVEYRLSRAA